MVAEVFVRGMACYSLSTNGCRNPFLVVQPLAVDGQSASVCARVLHLSSIDVVIVFEIQDDDTSPAQKTFHYS